MTLHSVGRCSEPANLHVKKAFISLNILLVLNFKNINNNNSTSIVGLKANILTPNLPKISHFVVVVSRGKWFWRFVFFIVTANRASHNLDEHDHVW